VNPYQNLPRSAFWRHAVAEVSPLSLREVHSKKFEISKTDSTAAAGSCFAQHITRYLKRHGYNVLDLERAPPWLNIEYHSQYGFSTYSARYGNIYTVQQLSQLIREVEGTFKPQNICWVKDGRFYDALRPSIEPEGFESEEELYLHRKVHIEKLRQMLFSMDVFIFTLGLTEAWIHNSSGTVYPTAPGVIAGDYKASEYSFINYEFADLEHGFKELLVSLNSIRGERPIPRILLTVSPVPLTATAAGMHVLQATAYSKGLLRAFAGQLTKHHKNIDYFPSYEIITNQAARGIFFEKNMRNVSSEGVEVAMKMFFESYLSHLPDVKLNSSNDNHTTNEHSNGNRNLSHKDEGDVQCEDAILEAFGK